MYNHSKRIPDIIVGSKMAKEPPDSKFRSNKLF